MNSPDSNESSQKRLGPELYVWLLMFGNKCLGAHILFGGNCKRRYLSWLRTIPSVGVLISTFYILALKALNLMVLLPKREKA